MNYWTINCILIIKLKNIKRDLTLNGPGPTFTQAARLTSVISLNSLLPLVTISGHGITG